MNEETDISADVRALIARHIESVVHLELLLLFQQSPARARTADAVASELRIESTWAAAQLAKLSTRGLLGVADPAGPSYRFAPASPDIARAVDGLALAYAARRVSVISLIYSKPSDPLRTFSDAFRLRKDDTNG